ALRRHEDGGVIAVIVGRQLGVADVEADAELARFFKQWPRLRPGQLALEIAPVDLRLILHPPARKEGGERKLGEDDELRAHGMALAQQLDEPPGCRVAWVG